MSKMDQLRAMREARYKAATTEQQSPPTREARPTKAPVAPISRKGAAHTTPSEAEELCGHRNMSGRTCTREAKHAAKSHRYS